uniref:Uncharacterized protein MANES_16G053000 n=1 Tax=Rhizophora mucronata TaxID=61149 RepID=A0A2P2M1L3_RHIMU
MSLSLMDFQMTLVISSPSNSTMGLATLILSNSIASLDPPPPRRRYDDDRFISGSTQWKGPQHKKKKKK